MQDLDHIAAFGAFFDFLENPSKYKKIVEDAAKVTKESKEVIEKQRKIKDVDAWRASEGARLSKIVDELNRKEESHLKNLADLASQIKAHKKSVGDANKRIRDRESVVSSREEAVSGLEKQKTKLDKLEGEYSDKLENLRQEKERLKVQAQKIQAAAGNL